MASQLFLISYILDDQPMTCELHSKAETSAARRPAAT